LNRRYEANPGCRHPHWIVGDRSCVREPSSSRWSTRADQALISSARNAAAFITVYFFVFYNQHQRFAFPAV